MAERSQEGERSRPSLPARTDYGAGCFRRRIVLEATSSGVRGELADDFHHFAVDLTIRDGRVAGVEGEGIRVPWATCPGALASLRALVDLPLTRDLRGLHRSTAPRTQCTHLHDLACLAVAHADRLAVEGDDRRVLEVALPDRVAGETTATLDQRTASEKSETSFRLEWQIEGNLIASSTADVFSGVPLSGRAFQAVLGVTQDPDLVEAAWVLQRAVFVGTGRRHDFERMPTAETFASVVGGACHSFAPERVAEAKKIPGTVRDFSTNPESIFERD